MAAVWYLLIGLFLLLCAAITGWDALLVGSGLQLVMTLLMLILSAFQIGRCAQLRRSGLGWTQRPPRRTR